jgi:hypothetical protein
VADWKKEHPDEEDEDGYLGNEGMTRRTVYNKKVLVLSSAHSRFWAETQGTQVQSCLAAAPGSWQRNLAKQVLARAGGPLTSAEVELSRQVHSAEEFCKLLETSSLERCDVDVLRSAFAHFAKDLEDARLKQLFANCPGAVGVLDLVPNAQLRAEIAQRCVANLLSTARPAHHPSPVPLWLDWLETLYSLGLEEAAAPLRAALCDIVGPAELGRFCELVAEPEWQQRCASGVVARLISGRSYGIEAERAEDLLAFLFMQKMNSAKTLLLWLVKSAASWKDATVWMAKAR